MNERLKEVRESLGLSTRAFAEKLGMTSGAISMLETGKRNPSKQYITSICNAFGVNEDWLRDGIGEMYAPKTRERQVGELTSQLFERADLDEATSANLVKMADILFDLSDDEIKAILAVVHRLADNTERPE